MIVTGIDARRRLCHHGVTRMYCLRVFLLSVSAVRFWTRRVQRWWSTTVRSNGPLLLPLLMMQDKARAR